ncbi:MAG: tetrathionate reductase family octaheme c-type cytochrome [Ignavibacteriaceae bacterium]
MKKIILTLLLIGLVVLSAVTILIDKSYEQSDLEKLKEKYPVKYSPSADHSKFPVLQKKFASARDVTETCISCHNERHKEVMQSNHWNWEREEYIEGKGIVSIGKKNAINNFCIGVEGNEQSCAKCHIGYEMTSEMFSYTDPKNIDCLVCHDNTETYVKGSELAGLPDPSVNLNVAAQGVGKPQRSNCGVCHFFGGGGNNVKHGDLEKSMFSPSKDIDVHMAVEGVNLQCIDCHKTEKHNISGKMYSLSSMNRDRTYCEDCHTENPHEAEILNEHTIKVACQTCHIPTYAKVNATKMDWDWSTAGKLKNGEPYEEDDEDGNHTYLSIKGSFKWGKNLKPDYVWFNGTADHYLLGEVFSDTINPLQINTLNGSYNDEDSKIIPVKIHRSVQPYDPVYRVLIQPKLFSDKKGEGAFWQDFNWRRASEVGMKDADIDFSGQVGFIKTEMYWPVNHMVSTKELTVQCTECHTRDNSRLAALNDFYMPGRDYSKIIDNAGTGIIIMTFIGVLVHSGFRIFSTRKLKKRV